MAFLGQEFRKDDLPKSTDYDPVPAGWYEVSIVEAEVKDTKAGTGKYINVRYDIVGPSHQGRVVFGMLNIQNANAKAEEIGRQQLGDLMGALGIASLRDTDQLIGGRLSIKVKVEKSEEYGDRNSVTGWKAIAGAKMPTPPEPKQPQTQGSAMPSPAPSNGATPPW